MKFLIGVALLNAVFTVANAITDCTVCLNGQCHASAGFYDGINKISTSHMVIDFNSNILYHYNEGINAINLDTNTMTPIPMQGKGNYLAVDQDTGDLYYYRNANFNNTIYKYHPKTGQTEVINVPIPESSPPPLNVLVHNGSLYFNTHRESGYDVANGLNILTGSVIKKIAALDNFTVNNIVIDKNGIIYIKSGPEIYRLMPNANEAVLFVEAKYLISGDRNGEVYFFDPSNRYFYKVNEDGDDLINIGAYDPKRDGRERPKLKEFIFDKHGNVIIKDKWSTMYYKSNPSRCTFTFDGNTGRTRITKVKQRK
ncbi:uncharacterized protein LOC125225280 isoform X2 [Leguminivora glycinivorella]|uniref:uncharacterized protein LOC125225280 isoform X1 n=1 Tax=Leguminivora glycinivorella TaxID=1035111 RepID=UPI00200CCA73|nr:uncharacterized protein LOC125225280 isoform X1 [Leguminivora glycinivorella]XP_047984864.1 uncharacterized protein LOC125225280 isoform X2 [Leguminivora glycinivorella]